MTWRDLVLRVRALLFRSQLESELDEEVTFHLEMEARKYLAAGLDHDRAARKAVIAFGGAEQAKEACRDTRGTRWVENFFHDLRFGVRMLSKDRGYALATVAALAVGIGANTALYTVFAATALKPLPVPDPSTLVTLGRTTAHSQRPGWFSFADYAYYRDHTSSLASVAAETPDSGLHLTVVPSDVSDSVGVAEPIMGLFVTANYFTTFGVAPIVGRGFLPEDDQRTAGPYPALLSDNYWQRRFGRNPDVLGQTLRVSGTPIIVGGITPRDFMGTRPDVPDVWITMSARGDFHRRALDRTSLCCSLTARLKTGVTVQQAQADLSVLASTLRLEYPPAERQWNVLVDTATPFGPNHASLVAMFTVLQVAMGLVLFLACANVAGLLLGKAATRRREIAVRLSLGATRSRLVRQLLTEGILMAALAGATAFLVTWQVLAFISRSVSAAFAAEGGTIVIDVTPDLRVFSYVVVISLLSGLSFALAPALQSTRLELVTALKDDHAGFGGRRTGRWRGGLVTGQIAVCLALLVGAGLLTANTVRLLSIDPGFDTRSVLTMTVSSPQELGYSVGHMRDVQTHLYERLRTVPSVRSLSFASRIPLGGTVTSTRVIPQESDAVPSSDQRSTLPYAYVSQDYFQTLGIPLLRGRAFTAQEIATHATVAVISDALARRFWPGDDALGKRIAIGSPTEVHYERRPVPFSLSTDIVGIARDVYSMSLATPDPGAVYLPKPGDEWNGFVFASVVGDPEVAAGALVREVRAVEPSLPVSIETLHHVMTTGEAAKFYRIAPLIFAAIGVMGFALAAVGVYSMVAYTVSQYTREVGIRIALGAQRWDIVRVLLRGSVKSIAPGLLIGALLGAILSHVLASQLLWQGVIDPGVILVVTVMIGILAMLAAYCPARRAAKLDPAVTLRFD
jgi:putative ABC transport system permease protein